MAGFAGARQSSEGGLCGVCQGCEVRAVAGHSYPVACEGDALLTPVRDRAVHQGVGHATVGPDDPPPGQVFVGGRHDPSDDPRARAEELGNISVRDDAADRYEPYHHRDVVREAHVAGAPIASVTWSQSSAEAAARSTPCGGPGAYGEPSSSRATAPSSSIISAAAAWSQGLGLR